MVHRPQLRLTGDGAPKSQPRRRGAVPALSLLFALLVALLVTACSSGGGLGTGGDDSGGGGESLEAEGGDGDAGLRGLGGQEGRKPTADLAARVGPLTRQVIRTGEVTLQAEDVAGLREEVDRLVQRYGGYVSSERSFTDDEGRLVEDRLVLRVPSARYDRVMSDFAEVATVLAPSHETDDVTTEVIDVDSRVRTAEVSLDRLRSFLRRSTDVDAMIRLESEMAEREADLASLRAQQDYLEDQTSLATISVTLQRPPEDEPAEASGDGFLAGLAGGWAALKEVLVVTATVLGALIPFALVAAILGVPLLLALRSARRRRPVTPGQAPPPATPASPA